MRILCDVFNAAGNRLGEGPVTTLLNVSVERVLSGCGTITFNTPATDDRVVELLTPRRRIRIYGESLGTVREIGRGIILRRQFNESSSGTSYSFTCADNLEELKYRNTLVGRVYSGVTLKTVIDDLISLVPGWSASIESSVEGQIIHARFDGSSVLKALQELCVQTGLHFRLGDGNVIEFGEFGEMNDLAVMNTRTVNAELQANDDVALIDTITAGDDAEDIVNWIIPLGAGEGVASLKLKRSDRTSPYAIMEGVNPNGKKYWAIQDSASINNFGRIERVVTFKGIQPVTNSRADKIAAANALYDAASTWLARMSVPRVDYGFTLKKVKRLIRPGERINIRYRGRVTRQGGSLDYVNINQDLWVTKVNESIAGDGGVNVSVEVSNVDASRESVREVIVNTIEEVKMKGLKPSTSVGTRSFVYSREIAPGFPALVPVEITNATLELIRLRVRIKTTPFRATSVQGDHRHVMFDVLSSGFDNPPVSVVKTVTATRDEAGTIGSIWALGMLDVLSAPTQIFTRGAAGGVVYGIADDTQHPQNITVRVNGINRTTDLGGAFAPTNAPIDILLDVGKMTGYIDNDPNGLNQVNILDIRCNTGRGRIEVTVEIYEVSQAVEVD